MAPHQERHIVMKRLIAATIAITLLGSTAAMADGYRGHRGYGHHDNAGPAIAVGLGIAALAIIATSQYDRDRYRARGYYYAPNGYYYRNRGDYHRYRLYYSGRDYDDYGYYAGGYPARGHYARGYYARGYGQHHYDRRYDRRANRHHRDQVRHHNHR